MPSYEVAPKHQTLWDETAKKRDDLAKRAGQSY